MSNIITAPFTDGLLIVTTQRWICPCGKYKQDWADKFMSEC